MLNVNYEKNNNYSEINTFYVIAKLQIFTMWTIVIKLKKKMEASWNASSWGYLGHGGLRNSFASWDRFNSLLLLFKKWANEAFKIISAESVKLNVVIRVVKKT